MLFFCHFGRNLKKYLKGRISCPQEAIYPCKGLGGRHLMNDLQLILDVTDENVLICTLGKATDYIRIIHLVRISTTSLKNIPSRRLTSSMLEGIS